MVVDEGARHALHERLDDVLGREVATTLMAHLPPVGWQDVATRRDIDHLAAATQRDLAVLGSHLRQEMAELGGELRQEMAGIREDLASLRIEVSRDLNRQTWKLFGGVLLTMVATVIAVTGIMS